MTTLGDQVTGPALGLLLTQMPPTKLLPAKQPLSLQGPRPRRDKGCSGLESASLASSCDFPWPRDFRLNTKEQEATTGHVGGRGEDKGCCLILKQTGQCLRTIPWSPLLPHCPFLLPTDKGVRAVPCLQKACPHPSRERKLALGPTFKMEE